MEHELGAPEVMAEGRYLRLVRRPFAGGAWEYVERPGVTGIAVMLAVTDDGRVPLIRQFRVPLAREVWELPAGLCDRREDLATTAVRELEEECGLTASTVEHLATTPAGQASVAHVLDFFVLTDLSPADRAGDEPFPIHCELVPLDSVPGFLAERAAAGELVDARIFAALHFARERGVGGPAG